MKIIPVLGWATRVSKKNPQIIDYLALENRKSFLNLESNKAKTRRIIGALGQIAEKDPDFVQLCLGLRLERLKNIKSLKDLPYSAIAHADIRSKPLSALEALKRLYCHYILDM